MTGGTGGGEAHELGRLIGLASWIGTGGAVFFVRFGKKFQKKSAASRPKKVSKKRFQKK